VAGNKAKTAPARGVPTERDVTIADRTGERVKIGSIVEIARWPNDRYYGLYYVVAIEAGERGLRVLVAADRWGKWDFKVHPSRVALRCYEPLIAKGE